MELPSHGELTFLNDGSFDYTPPPAFVGRDQFTYSISDGLLDSLTATVDLYVGVPPVEINEIVAENHRSLLTRTRDIETDFSGDPESYDWIEIYNPTADAFDVGGMFLTDDRDDLQKWQFPRSTSIAAYDYLIVFASGLNLLEPTLDENGALHANFRLSDTGDQPSLANVDGTFLQGFLDFESQRPDVSYGQVNNVPSYLAYPTPGEPNSAQLLGVLAPVSFSVARGFFDAPFTLSLNTPSPETTIYYTLDGSQPTPSNGTAFVSPFAITGTTAVRATAFRENFVPSRTITQSYLFLNDILSQPSDPSGFPERWGSAGVADYAMDSRVVSDSASLYYDPNVAAGLTSLPSISIVMDVDDFFDAEIGIQSNPERRGLNWERTTSVEFLEFDAFDDFQLDAGIRIVGNASRRIDRRKHNMRLAFRDDYGFSQLAVPLFDLGENEAHDNLILRGGNGDSWINPGVYPRAQYIRDQWQRDVQLAMGHESTHQIYAHLYINGLYWGLYHVFERHDASFMALNFGGDAADYDAIKDVNGTSNVDAVDGDTQGWLDVMEIIASNLPLSEKYDRVDQMVDLDNMIDYLLLNFYHGNNDWDHNNFRTGRHRDGKFVFFAWDAERADINSLQVSTNQIGPVDRDITGFSKPNRPTRIHSVLSNDTEYRLRFADRIQRHMYHGGPLTPEGARSIWNARADEIRLAMSAESARWGDLHPPGDRAMTVADWESILEIMNSDFFPVRTGIVLDQLRNRSLIPQTPAPTFNQLGGLVTSGFEVQISSNEGNIWFTADGTDPRIRGGEIAPFAHRYTDIVELFVDTTINARVLHDGEWSPLSSFRFEVEKMPADASNLRISEIHYHPSDPLAAEIAAGFSDADEFEFLELFNIGSDEIDLSKVELTRDGANGVAFDFATSPIQSLHPGERIVVVENIAAFQFRYGTQIPIAGQWAGRLSNRGEQLWLQANDETVHKFTYLDSWHAETDGRGRSLEIVDATQADVDTWASAANWRASSRLHGSPGQSNRRGDFSGDGGIDSADLDILHQQLRYRTQVFSLDFNQDHVVDSLDLTDWLDLAGVANGDANLDGRVNALDFDMLSTQLFTSNNGWTGGDFNADGVTDGYDFNIWNANRQPVRAALPVPQEQRRHPARRQHHEIQFLRRRQVRHEPLTSYKKLPSRPAKVTPATDW